MTDGQRCTVCGKATCRPFSHVGPLPAALGGTRSKHGPVEDRAKRPAEDR